MPVGNTGGGGRQESLNRGKSLIVKCSEQRARGGGGEGYCGWMGREDLPEEVMFLLRSKK